MYYFISLTPSGGGRRDQLLVLKCRRTAALRFAALQKAGASCPFKRSSDCHGAASSSGTYSLVLVGILEVTGSLATFLASSIV